MRGLFVALITVAGSAVGAEVYVNGVNVAGLTNQTFEKVSVRLDEKGNVHIDAPGYSVRRVTVAEPAQPMGILTQKYFLVTEQTSPGATEFDIDVVVNGRPVRTLGSAEPQLVAELTQELKPGKNSIVLQARKRPESQAGPRSSSSKSDVFRVIIGEGTAKNEQVVIDRQLITFTRTAAEPGDVTQEFTLTTR